MRLTLTSLFITFASASILAIVWAAQIGGLAPCPLCLQQRYAYYIIVPLAAYAVFAARHYPASIRGLLLVIALIFILNGFFGIYHSGIEYGWWQGAQECAQGGKAVLIDSTQDLWALLQTELVPCDTPAFRFLFLSLAGYNALASFALAALAFYGAKK